MIIGKDMRREKFLLLSSIHLIFIFAFIASLILRKNDGIGEFNYFFTAFICSGIILSGLSWRSNSPVLLRLYFSIFIITIPLFLFSPSMLLNFLLTTNFKSSIGPAFHLQDQYFLETQSTSKILDNKPHYKLIFKRGIFHQTIQRDIVFGGKLDSVKVIEIVPDKNMILRGYSNKTTYVSSEIDSVDAKVLLKVVKNGDVEYRL